MIKSRLISGSNSTSAANRMRTASVSCMRGSTASITIRTNWIWRTAKGTTKSEWLEQIAFLDSLFPYSSTGRYPMRYRDAEDKGDSSKILLPKERELGKEICQAETPVSTPFEIAMARLKERSVDPKQTMDDALEQIRMRAERGEGNE